MYPIVSDRPSAGSDPARINIQLRVELAARDEQALASIDAAALPVEQQNIQMAIALAWAEAPVLPIRQWTERPLELPAAETLEPSELHRRLRDVIAQLNDVGVAVDFPADWTEREMYDTIGRDVLPSFEKKVESRGLRAHVRFVQNKSYQGRVIKFRPIAC